MRKLLRVAAACTGGIWTCQALCTEDGLRQQVHQGLKVGLAALMLEASWRAYLFLGMLPELPAKTASDGAWHGSCMPAHASSAQCEQHSQRQADLPQERL